MECRFIGSAMPVLGHVSHTDAMLCAMHAMGHASRKDAMLCAMHVVGHVLHKDVRLRHACNGTRFGAGA